MPSDKLAGALRRRRQQLQWLDRRRLTSLNFLLKSLLIRNLVNRPNPTLKEIEQWLKELPTIKDLISIPGFEISKLYYFVRMGGRWHIGKENPYVDVKSIAGKPDNILCFADGDNINKRIAGKRDSESSSLHTVRIQALKRDEDNLDKFLMGIKVRKDFVDFTWSKSPQEIYKEQIKDYKKSHNINNNSNKLLVFLLIIGIVVIYFYERKFSEPDVINPIQTTNDDLLDKLSLEYQKLSINKKLLFLRRTGLSTVEDSKSTFESKSLKDFILRHFSKNKSLFDSLSQRNSFLRKLSNEMSNFR